MASTLEHPLTAHSARNLIEMRLERHAVVKERGAGAATRAPGRGRRSVAPFDEEGFGASTALGGGAGGNDGEEEEEEPRGASDSGDVEYEDHGAISVRIDLEEIREYFTKIKSRHKDSVGQPQEWFGIVVSDRTMRKWTAADQRAPPKGWVQDGWDGQDACSVKNEYILTLVLKGAINELLTNTEMPETQKEDLSLLLKGIRLHKRADEHMEVISDKLEPLIVAGYTFIRGTQRHHSPFRVSRCR